MKKILVVISSATLMLVFIAYSSGWLDFLWTDENPTEIMASGEVINPPDNITTPSSLPEVEEERIEQNEENISVGPKESISQEMMVSSKSIVISPIDIGDWATLFEPYHGSAEERFSPIKLEIIKKGSVFDPIKESDKLDQNSNE